jgi:nucleotide-binding universal stress UspA family protein
MLLEPLDRAVDTLEKILVGVDFSPGSHAALERAAELAAGFGATVDLLHVWNAPPYVAPEAMVGFSSGTSQTLAEVIRANAEKSMKEFLTSARQKGIQVEHARVECGDPARTIVEMAEQGDYDLIALGTHGRTGLSHFLVGSVAETVVRRAHRPVLTVRGPSRRAA